MQHTQTNDGKIPLYSLKYPHPSTISQLQRDDDDDARGWMKSGTGQFDSPVVVGVMGWKKKEEKKWQTRFDPRE